jgi:hypothetical protein
MAQPGVRVTVTFFPSEPTIGIAHRTDRGPRWLGRIVLRVLEVARITRSPVVVRGVIERIMWVTDDDDAIAGLEPGSVEEEAGHDQLD